MNCIICNSFDDEKHLIVCDVCNQLFHTGCLNMDNVPSGVWYCAGCVQSAPASTTTTTSGLWKPKPKANDPKIGEPKYVHVYARVSTKGQNKPEFGRVGMDTQNSAVLEFCQKHNLYVKSTTTEVGSAYHPSTSNLEKLVKDVKRGEPIMVLAVSRFSRNVKHAKNILDQLHAKGSYVWSVTDDVTSLNPIFLGLIQAAENESRLSGERIKASHQRILKMGGFRGRTPFGYDKVRVNGVFKLKKNRLEQKILKKIDDVKDTFQKGKGADWFQTANRTLAFAMRKYPRYHWTMAMLHTNQGQYDEYLVESEDGSGTMDGVLDAIEDVDVDAGDKPESNVYIVKQFHGIRFNRQGVYEVMVEWEGYGKSQCTFENVVSMYEDVPEMLVDYLESSKSVYAKYVLIMMFPKTKTEML